MAEQEEWRRGIPGCDIEQASVPLSQPQHQLVESLLRHGLKGQRREEGDSKCLNGIASDCVQDNGSRHEEQQGVDPAAEKGPPQLVPHRERLARLDNL